MDIRFLENFDLTELHQTFLHAFSDYLVPLNPSLNQFQELLKRRGARNDISVGVFENDVPVGFTLNAFETYQSIPTVYDVATGIVPEARRKGIAQQSFEFSLQRLKTIGAARYVLEVFETNFPAVHLYNKIGFSLNRKFEVFNRSGNDGSETRHHEVFSIRELEPDWSLFQTFWDWQPSWQNSVSSINRIQGRKHILGIYEDSRLIGYGVIFPDTGDIPQFAIHPHHRKKGAGSTLLHNLQSFAPQGKATRVVNVDGSAEETIHFLKKAGYGLLGRQNEMEMKL